MRAIAFILTLGIAAVAIGGCEHAHPGGYEAPSQHSTGGIEENIVVKIDSSVEKAVANDTVKRDYHL